MALSMMESSKSGVSRRLADSPNPVRSRYLFPRRAAVLRWQPDRDPRKAEMLSGAFGFGAARPTAADSGAASFTRSLAHFSRRDESPLETRRPSRRTTSLRPHA